jgi:hypothetical protein
MEYLGGKNKKADRDKEKILAMDTILALEDAMREQCKGDKKKYNDYLVGKFVGFVEDKEILDSYVRAAAGQLDIVGKYILLEFGGLIVSCFELPMFKRVNPANDKDDEMIEYIKDFSQENCCMIPELRTVIEFASDDIRREYEDYIRQNNLLPEVEPVYEGFYEVLDHYPAKQPYLRERIAALVFLPEIECPVENKLCLLFFLCFIIDFLSDYYFDCIELPR